MVRKSVLFLSVLLALSRALAIDDPGGGGFGVACPPRHFRDEEGECVPWTDCVVGQSYRARAGTPTSDRICNDVTPCKRNQYQTHSPTLTSDRICADLSLCLPTDFEASPPSLTTDRICQTEIAVRERVEQHNVLEPEMERVTHIHNALELLASRLRDVILPSLFYTKGRLALDANTILRTAEFPSLEHVGGDLVISGNLILDHVALPKLRYIGGMFYIYNNNNLNGVPALSLTFIGGHEIGICENGDDFVIPRNFYKAWQSRDCFVVDGTTACPSIPGPCPALPVARLN